MPTYEYACTSCGNEFERFESIKAKPDKFCPKCNKKKAERLISGGGGFIFKGSGFYLTDYKKHPGGTDKTEAKPAAKSDAPAATPCSGGGCACHPAPKPAKKSA
ncbi:MAG TPA: zinc ribbon domain-containing protein [Planctomycetota bacterium]|nr:zinc ribbon domain-containing protein [Planctomycetota bacterium]